VAAHLAFYLAHRAAVFDKWAVLPPTGCSANTTRVLAEEAPWRGGRRIRRRQQPVVLFSIDSLGPLIAPINLDPGVYYVLVRVTPPVCIPGKKTFVKVSS